MSITSILYSEENFDSLPNDGLIKSLTRTVKLLLPLVKPVYGQLIASLLLRFLLIFPALFQPYVIKRLIDNVFIQRDPEELLWCFASLSLLPIIQQILFQLRTVSDASVEKSIDVNLTLQVYEHVQRLQVRFFLETSSGELLSRITTDVYAIYRYNRH
jgi:ABC-type bacteriocin/lantibiotic exporter with double-glycine peptidase domain